MRDAVEAPAPARPPRWVLSLLFAAVAALVVASNVGAILAPTLVKRHPAVLIALNYRNMYLAAVSPRLDPLTFYGIGFARSVVSDPIFYALGLVYGDTVLRWAQRKLGEGARWFLWLERMFHKARYPMVALAPNNIICLLAGATRMPVAAFVALNVSGTAVRLVLIRLTGEAFEAPIRAVTDFVDAYRWPLLALSVAVFVLSNRRRRGGGELGELRELKEQIEGGEAAREETGPLPAEAGSAAGAPADQAEQGPAAAGGEASPGGPAPPWGGGAGR